MSRYRRTAPVKVQETTMPARMNGHAPLFGLRFSIETITPEIAQKYLDSRHPNQRRISEDHKRRLAFSMKHGLWLEPPYSFGMLAFLETGELVNGQHRLLALIDAEVTLKFLCVRNIKIPPGWPLPNGDESLRRKGAFTHAIDDRTWQAAKALTDLAYGTGIPDEVVPPIAELLQPAAEAMPYRKTFAAFRAAFLWRYANQQAVDGQTLVDWYNAWTAGSTAYDDLPPALKALWVHLKERKPDRGGTGRREVFAKTLYALDKSGNSITCRTIPAIIDAFRAEFNVVASYLNWFAVEEL